MKLKLGENNVCKCGTRYYNDHFANVLRCEAKSLKHVSEL